MGVFVLRGIGFITQNYEIVIFWGGELNVFQVAEGQRKTEVIDLWSEDTKQDAWFTQSALDVGFRWLETAYPGFSVYLFSGKSHEQSNMNMKLVIMICTIQKVLVVHISHKIVQWVRLGNDLESGEQVAELIEVCK